jgi:hypothetical protein
MWFYWEAWGALRYDRAYIGMSGSEMPIPFSSLDGYARRYGIDGELFDRFVRFISVIDFVFLDTQREAAKAEAAKSEADRQATKVINGRSG